MKPVCFLIFLLTVQLIGISQNMNEYSYIVVPDQFEFQTKINQYQLNDMSKFYLNKNGFHAFLNSEAPNADRCDGLYMDVEYDRSWLQTRMEVVIRDCREKEIYRSPIGKSKLKELDKSKQEALRSAFSGLSGMKISQKPLDLKRELKTEQKVISTKQAETPVRQKTKTDGPSNSFTSYYFQDESYILRKTEDGYSLYKESISDDGNLKLTGKISNTNGNLKFLDLSGKESEIFFDDDGSLIINDGETEKVFIKSE